MAADFRSVPVVEVHKENLTELWPALLLSVKSATFLAIDTELSGLGNRKLLNARDLDDRYHHMCEIARTRSIVSLGLSCFKELTHNKDASNGAGVSSESSKPQGISKKLTFQVQTYNIVMLCNEQYMVEPTSLRFLVEHGFDFNKQYSSGLPYRRGNDKEESASLEEPSVRNLFAHIVINKTPVIFHNGVVDLVFLYHNLFASLPTSQQSFLASISEIFPAGVFDTKYITDFKARLGASYLEFVFRKCQRDNIVSKHQGWSHTGLEFLDYSQTSDNVIDQTCGLPDLDDLKDLSLDALCMQYANHGWCPSGSDCPKSHDIDIILETQDRATPSKRHKMSQAAPSKAPASTDITDPATTQDSEQHTTATATTDNGQEKSISSTGSHRAGFDAFMTGFIFAFFSARYGKVTEDCDLTLKGAELGMEEYRNKVYLVGKDIPLQIMKSSFVKTSKEHRAKLKTIGLT